MAATSPTDTKKWALKLRQSFQVPTKPGEDVDILDPHAPADAETGFSRRIPLLQDDRFLDLFKEVAQSLPAGTDFRFKVTMSDGSQLIARWDNVDSAWLTKKPNDDAVNKVEDIDLSKAEVITIRLATTSKEDEIIRAVQEAHEEFLYSSRAVGLEPSGRVFQSHTAYGGEDLSPTHTRR